MYERRLEWQNASRIKWRSTARSRQFPVSWTIAANGGVKADFSNRMKEGCKLLGSKKKIM